MKYTKEKPIKPDFIDCSGVKKPLIINTSCIEDIGAKDLFNLINLLK